MKDSSRNNESADTPNGSAPQPTKRKHANEHGEKVSMAPLGLKNALSGLLGIPDPDATKPKAHKPKRKKAAPTNEG